MSGGICGNSYFVESEIDSAKSTRFCRIFNLLKDWISGIFYSAKSSSYYSSIYKNLQIQNDILPNWFLAFADSANSISDEHTEIN